MTRAARFGSPGYRRIRAGRAWGCVIPNGLQALSGLVAAPAKPGPSPLGDRADVLISDRPLR